MTGQLNLFDWKEPATNSSIDVNKTMEQIEPKLLFDESVVVNTSIEKQTGITVVVPVKKENSLPRTGGIFIGQIVRINLHQKDTELYDYLKSYYPHVINKTSEIEEITYNTKGDCICSVNIRGTKLLFYTSELEFNSKE